jgi:hypothetical protein
LKSEALKTQAAGLAAGANAARVTGDVKWTFVYSNSSKAKCHAAMPALIGYLRTGSCANRKTGVALT